MHSGCPEEHLEESYSTWKKLFLLSGFQKNHQTTDQSYSTVLSTLHSICPEVKFVELSNDKSINSLCFSFLMEKTFKDFQIKF